VDPEGAAAGAAATATAASGSCTFAQLQQHLQHLQQQQQQQQGPDYAAALKGYTTLWDAASFGPTADPAAVEVQPFLLMRCDPDTLQECRDSLQTEGLGELTLTLDTLTGVQALLALPVIQQIFGQQQQQELISSVTTLVEECRQHLTAAEAAAAADAGAGEEAAADGNAAAIASADTNPQNDDVWGDAAANAGPAAAGVESDSTAATATTADAAAAAAAAAAATAQRRMQQLRQQARMAMLRWMCLYLEAQSILLSMCAAEQLLTRQLLIKLRSCLKVSQAAAVQLVSEDAPAQQQQQQQSSLERFMLSFEVSSSSHLTATGAYAVKAAIGTTSSMHVLNSPSLSF
jgi:hypothetical protein